MLLRKLWSQDEGQDIAEYAVMLSILLLISLLSIQAIGNAAMNLFKRLADMLGSVG